MDFAVAGRRIIAGSLLGAIIAAGIVAPAMGAADSKRRLAPVSVPVSSRNIATFTPASADPKLAALLARSGLDTTDFRFTPSESRRNGNRSVTVAVRARSSLTARDALRVAAGTAPDPTIGLAPIAYNLGVSVGWKRFALSGEMARVDLAGMPGSRESVDIGLTYSGKRATARLQASAERPLADTPRLASENPSYSIDVGGSYSLARNLDLTAGLRYKRESYRLERLTDNRRDSQAVYVGTAIRF